MLEGVGVLTLQLIVPKIKEVGESETKGRAKPNGL
jgi:hypothetical protein